MRIRASLATATVSGAVALTSLVAPAAHAADNPAGTAAKLAAAPSVAAVPADDVQGDTKITKVTVNADTDLVVGVGKKSFNIYVTANDPSGIYTAGAFLWHGTSIDGDNPDVDGVLATDQDATCDKWSATAATCKITITVDPTSDLYDSSLNGKWNVAAWAVGNDSDYIQKNTYKNHWVKRAVNVSGFNAGPEPVSKGRTITVTGTLNRASWTYLKYYGYGSQSVQLQFKKAGASSYSTVKTVTSSSSGYLKTTVTAAADGTWRFHYAGNSTSSAADAYDYVDVR